MFFQVSVSAKGHTHMKTHLFCGYFQGSPWLVNHPSNTRR